MSQISILLPLHEVVNIREFITRNLFPCLLKVFDCRLSDSVFQGYVLRLVISATGRSAWVDRFFEYLILKSSPIIGGRETFFMPKKRGIASLTLRANKAIFPHSAWKHDLYLLFARKFVDSRTTASHT